MSQLKTLRVVHRWLGAGVGIFLLGWTLSGIVMVLPNEWFGATGGRPLQAGVDYGTAQVSPAEALESLEPGLDGPAVVKGINLRRAGGILLYEVALEDGSVQWVNAHSGQRLLEAPQAGSIARQSRLSRLRNSIAGIHTFEPLRRLAISDSARKNLLIITGIGGILSAVSGYYLFLVPYLARMNRVQVMEKRTRVSKGEWEH